VIRFSLKAKIVCYILLIIIVFISTSLKINLILLGLVFIPVFNVPLSTLKRGLLPITIFLAFTFLSNTLFQTGRVMYEIIGLTITEEGLKRGGHLAVRLFTLILGAKILTATTPTEELVRGMTELLGPLGKLSTIKEFMFTLSLTLRFLPIIYNEAQILYKETMRNSPEATFPEKIKLLSSLLTPLFHQSMKKAKKLSVDINKEGG